jgi:hypothetical protein
MDRWWTPWHQPPGSKTFGVAQQSYSVIPVFVPPIDRRVFIAVGGQVAIFGRVTTTGY